MLKTLLVTFSYSVNLKSDNGIAHSLSRFNLSLYYGREIT